MRTIVKTVEGIDDTYPDAYASVSSSEHNHGELLILTGTGHIEWEYPAGTWAKVLVEAP